MLGQSSKREREGEGGGGGGEAGTVTDKVLRKCSLPIFMKFSANFCKFSSYVILAYSKSLIRAWLTEAQPSSWIVTVVYNSVDHTVENHVPNTIYNGLNRGLSSFRH